MKKILIASLVLFLAACGNKSKDKKAELEKLKKEQADISGKIADLEQEIGAKKEIITKDVNVYEVKTSPFKNYIEIQGKIDAEKNVQVTPEAAGVITKVYASIGQNVSAGQILAQIDDAVLRQNMAQLQTQLDLATNLFKRQKNLWDQKIGTEVQYLNAKSQKEGLEKQMGVLKQQADLYKIKSPISGTIDQMDYKVGQAVQPGAPGIRVVNANDLKAKALVSETYAGRINQGDEVIVVVPDATDSVKTKISFAAKTIDPMSRSFAVEVKLPSKKSFRPNMLAVLKIVDYANQKATVVPIKAIQKSETGDYLMLDDNGKAKKVEVKVGNIYNGVAEILEGIKPGDKVITVGLNGLNEGDNVKL
ncbi:efflux RND transporter periplasmic adaptor subunit [Pedobacter sp. SD-b]|uniref:Efflux RND transporter periplasmic adaptor subunit n=1 Tax=Pedobacter segetis TaxID=2793069 RepID=A0ABS1BFJ3_9SPHI|nr:efflux RND transporter periplasmic adaptor subunit [Pedobacter segetis]MBK0381629.1 efflux RND transporter periplasmic adaptor subunit [Pedobacter segetis]